MLSTFIKTDPSIWVLPKLLLAPSSVPLSKKQFWGTFPTLFHHFSKIIIQISALYISQTYFLERCVCAHSVLINPSHFITFPPQHLTGDRGEGGLSRPLVSIFLSTGNISFKWSKNTSLFIKRHVLCAFKNQALVIFGIP